MALDRQLPLCAYSRETFEHGALLSYGPDQIETCHRAAAYVDKILKGEKPGDIPVEQPTKFEFLINLKTAKALDLKVPLIMQTPYNRSKRPDYSDMTPLAHALVEAAPDRMLWGTNWPHPIRYRAPDQ